VDAVREGNDRATLLPQRHRANDLADGKAPDGATVWVQTVDDLADDIDEVKSLLADIPDRPLAYQALWRLHASDLHNAPQVIAVRDPRKFISGK
jgi:hypothetical protein